MSSDFLHDREKALEDSFFFKQDQQLLDKLKKNVERDKEKEALKTASGIENDAVLDVLLDAGINAKTAATVTLVPLVVVAWADGAVQPKEREAILQGAAESGMSEGDPAYKLLNVWLNEPPSDSLFNAWKGYIQALTQEIGPEQAEQLKRDIVGRVQHVAKVAGGVLGLAKVDAAERKAMQEIAAAFDTA